MKRINKASVSYHDDLVESLRGDTEAQLEFIKASFEENGDKPSAILTAIRIVAEARGFSHFAEEAVLNRENLYRVLSDNGNPRLDTFFKILDVMGLKLAVQKKIK